jgi:hypothetical protein
MTAPVKAAGIGHDKADDEAQCTGPTDPVLRGYWHRPCRGWNHGAGAMQAVVIRGFIAHNRESGAYTLTDRGRAALATILEDAGLK